MKPAYFPHRRRDVKAFTLIELIAVMAIILILAGLILGIAGNAQYKSSLERAKSEIKGMEAAIEAYKIDTGSYPSNTATDALNPMSDFDPAINGPAGTRYQASSEYLYQCLSGNIPAANGTAATTTKPYFDFKPNQLGIAKDAAGVTVATTTSPYMYVQDPFGFSFGYSTIYQKAVVDAAANPAATPAASPTPTPGYNPTFDLWSTAGYSATAGRGTPKNNVVADTPVIYSSLWVKNW